MAAPEYRKNIQVLPDSQQAGILGDAVGTGGSAGLDLAGIDPYCYSGYGGILGFTRRWEMTQV